MTVVVLIMITFDNEMISRAREVRIMTCESWISIYRYRKFLIMSHHAISALLEKTSNWDKDERYMATNDLITELGKEGVKLDDVMEKRISAAILKQLGKLF